MNMEMYVSGDFGHQAGVHNCTIIHPQSLKFWECDLHCDCTERERDILADCVCGGRRPWRILIKAQGNRERLKRIVMLRPCVCLCTSVPGCAHRMCIYLCWHSTVCIWALVLCVSQSTFMHLRLHMFLHMSILHMILHVFISRSEVVIKVWAVWKHLLQWSKNESKNLEGKFLVV